MLLLGFKPLLVVIYLQLYLFCSTTLAVTVIGHDKVVGFRQKVSGGVSGKLYHKFKPYLTVVDGCVPFPAVDSRGRVR